MQATEKREVAGHVGEMDMSVETGGPPPLQPQAGGPPPLQLQAGGPPPLQPQAGGPPPLQLQAGGPPPLQLHHDGRSWPLQSLPVEVIPEDPTQAETHYSQVSC